MVSAVFAMSSCGSTKEAASLSSLNGEWNIIEVNGSAIVPAENQELPFIGFDTATGKVYGNSGCNRMMGSIDLEFKPRYYRYEPIGEYPYGLSGYDDRTKCAECIGTGEEL